MKNRLEGNNMKIKAILLAMLMFLMPCMAYGANGDAFCVGCDMRPVKAGKAPINTMPEANNAATYFKSAGYEKKVPPEPTNADLTASNLNSSLLFLAGHGSVDSVEWLPKNSNKTYGLTTSLSPASGFVSTSNKSFSNTKVAILAACYAGGPAGLAYNINRKGAQLAFGWEAEVEHAALRDFDFLLVENLAKGYRFIDALPYVYASMAAGNTESEYKWDTINYSKPQDNPPYYRTCSYGDINVRITNTRAIESGSSAESYTLPNEDINIYSNITNVEHQVASNDYTNVARYIQDNIDADFNLNEFAYNEVEMVEGVSNSLITFRYMIDDFKSDFGYNVIVIDNEVKEIVKVGYELYDREFDISLANEKLDEAMLSYPRTFTDSETTDVIKLYDSKNNKFYCRVVKTFVDETGAAYCVGENVDL